MNEGEREALKQRVRSERGFWGPLQESLYRIDPSWLEVYLQYTGSDASVIPVKLRHLIYTCIDSSVTHLYPKGLALHIELAMKHGATREEVFEVLQLTSELGGMANRVGIPILMEELAASGKTRSGPSAAPTPRQAELKDIYRDKVGAWPAWLDALCGAAPDLAQGYLELATRPWIAGALAPREKALILVAAYASPTTLHEPSLRIWIRRALELGATQEELLHTLKLSGDIGMHTLAVGAPILVQITEGVDVSTYTVDKQAADK